MTPSITKVTKNNLEDLWKFLKVRTERKNKKVWTADRLHVSYECEKFTITVFDESGKESKAVLVRPTIGDLSNKLSDLNWKLKVNP
jgi:hypothetical protein